MSFRVIRPEKLDLMVGILMIAAVVNCANIRLGRSLPLIGMLFIFYALFGQYIKGNMGTVSFTIQRVISNLTMETGDLWNNSGNCGKTDFVFRDFRQLSRIEWSK